MPKLLNRGASKEDRYGKRVMQLFARGKLPAGFSVRAATAERPAEILLYDEIGAFGITAKQFVEALAQLGAEPIVLRINSPGGDVFDGLAIYNAVKGRPAGRVDVVVDGLAASAASFIAMAGATVTMPEQSMLMIHNAWGIAIGDKAQMRELAGVLDKIDGQLATIYSARSGKAAEQIVALMDAETWFTAQEAKNNGFADVVTADQSRKALAPPAHVTRRERLARLDAVERALEPPPPERRDLNEILERTIALSSGERAAHQSGDRAARLRRLEVVEAELRVPIRP